MSESTLSPIESRLLAAIGVTPSASQEELGETLGVTPRYIRKLLARAHVKAALDAVSRDGLRDVTARLLRGADRAAASLIRMATGPDRATSARVQAARAVVSLALQLRQAGEMESRLAAIEAALAAAPNSSAKGTLQ